MISLQIRKNINISKSILLITIIIIIITLSNCCEEPFINCNNIDGSDCLPYEKVCDGKIDCFDKSDETADTCVQQINCPPLSFRCAYGACVPNTARCNGTKECADNSDEIPILCNSNFMKENSICLKDEFMCNSGECIAQEDVCDGHINCLDRSDETVEICASNLCDDMFFHCGYGACISTDRKCDAQIDCADGSDEASMLCSGIKRKTPILPATTPLPLASTFPLETTTRFDEMTCTVPDIKNSRITLESNPNNPLRAGDKISNFNFIKYGCEHGFFREGKVELNFCSNGTWFSNIHPPCIRYCPHEELHGVTFNVKCILNGVTVSCDERISPGTVAIVTCPTKYRIPDHNPIQTLLCSEKGQWDYTPSRCIPICGDELIPSVPFLTNADKTNITAVPWHVGVYINQKRKYKHHCGGTIISAKVIISAAHCFWDNANQKPYPNSLYAIGAGKYFREYYEDEIKAQIRNISQIAIPEEYAGEDSKFKADLAVIVVTNPFIFSEFVSPICIEWKKEGAKAIKSGSYGKVAGWGKTEEGIYSTELKTVSVTASSNEACKNEVESQYADAITDDKFCILNKFEKNACQGDSGGGFAVQKEISNRNRYFLWGIVSTGVPLGLTCSNYQFVSYTNIQYYEDFITDLEIRNRAK
ncbi:modular serine protease-like [Eupeodes corollae]|uniref:modular serine protease-like n=1 Tax=Eupeodes corollae TaxID=290404 RepID=UPI002492A7EA|nr:modular serine protease-like [Eupeodes corollae]